MKGATFMKTYNLERFITAQEHDYSQALSEIKSGRKKSHWIWYIFPQLKGLGRSYYADLYGIEDINEAEEYLRNEVLGARLTEISGALLSLESSDPAQVMGGFPDDMKLKSCMTLFAAISDSGSVFHKVLDKFFAGRQDEKTLALLRK